MKRVLVLALLIGTILSGGVLAYLIWKAPSRTAQDFLHSGKKYYEQRHYPEAVIQFLNALQKDDRNREARYLLSMSYLNQGDTASAVRELQALVGFYPDDVPANLQLGDLYLRAGPNNSDLFHQAGELATKVLDKDPQNIVALILSANADAGLKDYAASEEQLELALRLSPGNVNALVSLGTVQGLQKNFPAAEQAFLKAIQGEPKNETALLALANYYRVTGNAPKAQAAYESAFSAYPNHKNIYVPLVNFYNQSGRFADVERVLREAAAKSFRDPQPLLILANLYDLNNRHSESQTVLVELKQKFPQDIDVAMNLALSFMQDKPERARAEIDRVLKIEPYNSAAQTLFGELQFYSGDYRAAEFTFSKIPDIGGSYPQAHYFLGDIALRKGQIDAAQTHFQQSLLLDRGYLPARVALAEVLLRKGKGPDARVELNKALEGQPDYMPARLLKAVLDAQEKKFGEAEKEFGQLLREDSQNAVLHEKMASYYQVRGLPADAEKSLLRALELQPGSQQILQELIQLYVSENQTARAIEKINSTPDSQKQPFHYELLGFVYFKAGKSQESELAYKKALEKEPDRVNSTIYLAANYIQNGKLDAGIQELDLLTKKNPRDAGAYAAKGLVYESQGKLEEAKQNFTQALTIDRTLVTAANDLAYILGEEGRDLATALNWAQEARSHQPDNPHNADTLGWIQHKLGSNALAREELEFAASKEPDNPVFQYHLGVVYRRMKQITKAEAALKKALSSTRDFKERGLAETALKEISPRNGS